MEPAPAGTRQGMPRRLQRRLRRRNAHGTGRAGAGGDDVPGGESAGRALLRKIWRGRPGNRRGLACPRQGTRQEPPTGMLGHGNCYEGGLSTVARSQGNHNSDVSCPRPPVAAGVGIRLRTSQTFRIISCAAVAGESAPPSCALPGPGEIAPIADTDRVTAMTAASRKEISKILPGILPPS